MGQIKKLLSFPVTLCWFILIITDLFVIRKMGWLNVETVKAPRFFINYLLSAIGLFALLFILRHLLGRRLEGRIFALLIIGIPLWVQTVFGQIYDKFVTAFGFRIFITDTKMILGLNGSHSPWGQILLVVSVLFIVYKILFQAVPSFRKPRMIAPLILFLGTLSHAVFGWFSYNDFLNAPMAFYSAFSESLLLTSPVMKTDRPLPAPNQGVHREPILWIIGESTVKSHMSVYGYSRKTTPKMARLCEVDSMVAFNNVVTVGNKTNLAIPYLLTGLEGPDPGGRFYRSPTLFDYGKAAGLRTFFISAQTLRWGKMDQQIAGRSVDLFEEGSRFSSKVDVMKGADDGLVFYKGIKPILDTIREPFLLVYQMDGSHYPYSDHSPPAAKRFLPEESPNSVNAYDNTLLYTDSILYEVFSLFRSRFPNGWFFFNPDHGQDLGGRAAYNDSYRPDVIEMPLLVSAPASEIALLKTNRFAPLSTIDVFATILNLWQTKPILPIDGYSLREAVPAGRLRICSEYMPTFHNIPVATLIFPDASSWKLDFARKSVTLADGRTVMPVRQLPDSITALFGKRMGTPK